jgi:hypothetical protein
MLHDKCFGFDQALKQTADHIGRLDTNEIRLEKKIEQPSMTRAKLLPLLPQVTAALNFSEYALTNDKNRYLITPTLLRRWLSFAPDQNGQPILTTN